MKVTFVNGPPRSGKDFTGSLLANSMDGMSMLHGPCVRVDKFARHLKERTHALYNVREYGRIANYSFFEELKDEPREEFFGMTPRQAYIAVSETYMKVQHGDEIFGQLLLRSVQSYKIDELIITDSGFRGESKVIINHYGAKNCRLIRLHRDGCSYEKDSRSYLDLTDLGVRDCDVNNPGHRAGLLAELRLKLPRW